MNFPQFRKVSKAAMMQVIALREKLNFNYKIYKIFEQIV